MIVLFCILDSCTDYDITTFNITCENIIHLEQCESKINENSDILVSQICCKTCQLISIPKSFIVHAQKQLLCIDNPKMLQIMNIENQNCHIFFIKF